MKFKGTFFFSLHTMEDHPKMSVRVFWKQCSKELHQMYGDTESESICRFLLEHRLEVNYTGLFRIMDKPIDSSTLNQLQKDLNNLKDGVPLQHITGVVEFLDCRLKVSRDVLIPRPETEALVNLILEENKELEGKALDVGTGSGCIAVALKKHRPKAEVHGLDISEKALSIAKENAQENHAPVVFHHLDILNRENWKQLGNFDLVISNPPYVRQSEKSHMHKNVLEHDPHMALFVPDDDALIFYSRICEFLVEHLNDNGKVYFEINEQLGDACIQLLKQYGLKDVQKRKDLLNKDRYVMGTKI